MYFNKTNSFYHGIMFHHFHDNKIHKRGQGSISKDQLVKLINFVGKKNILDADIFLQKLISKKLKNNEVCLTFDDGLKCQYDIALPVLEDFKIKSFFFVYTSIFTNKPDSLEIFRFFRTNFFENIDYFYKDFYDTLNEDLDKFHFKNKKLLKKQIEKFPVFSIEDLKFRMVRDNYLTKKKYNLVMFKMIKKKKINIKKLYPSLFFSKNDLIKLESLGHSIGLHSHTHPTKFENLTSIEQKKEYEKCLKIISRITNKDKNLINSMSHPCGNYNKYTLRILKEIGIKIGFKETMIIEKEKGMKKINNSNLEVARIDHSDIIRMQA